MSKPKTFTGMDGAELKRRRKLAFRSQRAAADYFEVSRELIAKYEIGALPIRKIHGMAFDAWLPRG